MKYDRTAEYGLRQMARRLVKLQKGNNESFCAWLHAQLSLEAAWSIVINTEWTMVIYVKYGI